MCYIQINARCWAYILGNKIKVSAIRTVDPKLPQKQRYSTINAAWIVGFDFRDKLKNIKLVVEYKDTNLINFQNNVF